MNTSFNDSALFEKILSFCNYLRNIQPQSFSEYSLVQSKANDLLSLFKQRGDSIIQELHEEIRLKAEELLKELYQQALLLKEQLDLACDKRLSNKPVDWSEIAKSWARLGSKWVDSEKLKELIIKSVMDQTKHLIDRDLKVIRDYQQQSINPLSDDPSIISNLENRLNIATQEALQQFVALKNQPSDLNPEAASTWIKNIHAQRQIYFDKILLKIDGVIKELEIDRNIHDPISVYEISSELTFMEQELKYFAQEVTKHGIDLSGLKDLSEDLYALEARGIPQEIHSRFLELKMQLESVLQAYQDRESK